MKGHICQRAKGSWTIVYDLPMDAVTGKRRQKSQTVKGTKRDAERALREVLLSLEQGSYVKPNKMTLGELLRQRRRSLTGFLMWMRMKSHMRTLAKC
ncbi:MAG: hypothetical protein A2Z77_02125 [Chloroflexi bacterium RBG_13_51_36]|nr:MAG: hypothetical protein A2Z77_02125 [Chloroflexi bacterium RBG_13_51_36]